MSSAITSRKGETLHFSRIIARSNFTLFTNFLSAPVHPLAHLLLAIALQCIDSKLTLSCCWKPKADQKFAQKTIWYLWSSGFGDAECINAKLLYFTDDYKPGHQHWYALFLSPVIWVVVNTWQIFNLIISGWATKQSQLNKIQRSSG